MIGDVDEHLRPISLLAAKKTRQPLVNQPKQTHDEE